MPRACNQSDNCPCSTNPFANLSSENPDRLIFVGIHWSFNEPFLGRSWTSLECGKTCASDVSQQAADFCAERLANRCVLCEQAPVVSCEPEPPCNQIACLPQPISCPPPFGNVLQGCQNSQFTSVVPACTFFAHTQADADAIAASVCQNWLINGPHTPNPPGCIIITGMFPPSPIHANLCETVILSAAYTYPGSGPLTFLWFLDNIPLANTPTAVLNLDSIKGTDAGTYTLQISAPDCPTVISPPIILDVVTTCVPDTGPAAPKLDPSTTEYDYVHLSSKGIFDIPFSFDYGVCGTVNKVFLDCGVFPDGWYQVNINSGIAWHLTGLSGGVPFDNSYSLGIGVEYQVGGFPSDVADYPVDGCFGFPVFDPCPDPTAYMFDFFLATSYPILLVPVQQHNGGSIRIWGPTLYTSADPGTLNGSLCGPDNNLEIIQHELESEPVNVQIQDFSCLKDLITDCAACENRAGVEWDGTLKQVTYNPFDLRYEIPAPFDSNTISLNGKRISRSSCSIFLSELNDGTPIWLLQIKCKEPGQPNGGTSGDIVWQGFKTSGRTPVGKYMHTDTYPPWVGQACSTTPQCLSIIEI